MRLIYGPIFTIVMVYIFFLQNDGALFMQLVSYLTAEMTDKVNEAIQQAAP